jgi:anti-anti-sigma factor
VGQTESFQAHSVDFSGAAQNQEGNRHLWDDVVILQCVGRLVAGSETITFRSRVEKLLPAKRKVVINLGKVDYVDSTGVATLAYFITLNSDSETGLRLVSSRTSLRELLRRTRLGTVITVCANEEDVVASFHKPRSRGTSAGGLTPLMPSHLRDISVRSNSIPVWHSPTSHDGVQLSADRESRKCRLVTGVKRGTRL